MSVRIVDTTLRDGEQKAGIAFGAREKLSIVRLLDGIGVYQIEAGIPAMGGDEKRSIHSMMGRELKSLISAWNRMSVSDIKHSIDCEVDIIHISVPVSDIQIRSKLNKDRQWVLDTMKSCIDYSNGKGFETTIGLEDASRADFSFILEIIEVARSEGATRIRYADTVGVLCRQRTFQEFSQIVKKRHLPLEMHAHNDLGMAVANSLAAINAGAEYIDCTIGGMGERAGNCDFYRFVSAARAHLGLFRDVDLGRIKECERKIMGLINSHFR